MKMLKKNKFLLTVFLVSAWMGANAQTTLDAEVPGDNFSLEGALELFKKSASPEEFEKLLNSSDSKVNNLDLNNDGNIDYVRVIDRNDGNVHAFVLQAVLSQNESQDVAVIELQKLGDGKASLQITGDADVYGTETIIEPTEEVRVNAGYATARTVVNVWTWPSVQYVYSPYYSVWNSPWGWAYRPIWWQPWTPLSFYVYAPLWRPYRPYYSLCYSHRIGYMPQFYRPYRTTSVIVYNNYHNQINHYRTYNTGRDRYDGRSNGGRDRYDGYGGRSRSDYHGRSNYADHSNSSGHAYNGNNNASHDRYRNDGIGNSNNQHNSNNNGGNVGHSRSMDGRSFGHSSSSFGNSSNNTDRNTGSYQRSHEGRNFNQSHQSQPNFSYNSNSQRQHSFGGSSSRGRSFGGGSSRPSMPSGGGSMHGHSGGSSHAGGGHHGR